MLYLQRWNHHSNAILCAMSMLYARTLQENQSASVRRGLMAMGPHALVSINVFVCQYSIQILLCMALADDTVLNTVTIFSRLFSLFIG